MPPPANDRTGARRERLAQALATPERKARHVRQLFEQIAGRYDAITVGLSYGRDRHWKDTLTRMACVQPGERALDLACGTGDIAVRLAQAGATVTGLDVTTSMLRLARVRNRDIAGVHWVQGDMMALPLPTAAYDIVTVGYGLRNVPDLDTALREIRRVLRPGGRVLSLDFTLPASPVLRHAYLAYLDVVGGLVGRALHGDPDTYRYIPASLRRYAGAAGVAERMRALGFVDVAWWPLLGGLMAINTGYSVKWPCSIPLK
jgi:demethylmenaquinone methyltransferase/2-methoxy-6-polyprenyl-1,4-benzoquinol methylase